jgi:UPF0755 protein
MILKIVKKVITIFLIIVIVITIIEIFPKKTFVIVIPRNTPSEKIAKMLKEKGLIIHPEIFLTFTYLTNSDLKLKSGSYNISFSITGIPTIIKLRKGGKGIKVTIPEGFTNEQIANRLVSVGIIEDPVYFVSYTKIKNLEGFLFPETYYFDPGQKVEDICSKMVNQFYKNYLPEYSKRAYELNLTTYQVVTLASIVEKEAKSFEEKKLVAGVFHNRLKKHWPLEACSTVRYALKKYREPLTYKDTKVNSPYNTYKYVGLPIGPICNPGIDSIKAVLFFEPTDAMFFFTKDNETHQFSRYYKQHLESQNKKVKKVK